MLKTSHKYGLDVFLRVKENAINKIEEIIYHDTILPLVKAL